MCEPEAGCVENLDVNSIIGFDGGIIGGLVLHPDGVHVIYPLGNKVIVQNQETNTQDFLTSHNNTISAIDLSVSGKYIASGQINHIGFKARIVIWDFHNRKPKYIYDLHKVRVEALAFSKDEKYCISMGGRDCGSVIVWDLDLGQPLCGGTASHGSQGEVTCLFTMHRRGVCFLTAGDNHLGVWTIDKEARDVHAIYVSTNKLRRTILCVAVNERDEFAYCGTATGDLLKIRLNFHHDPEVLKNSKLPTMIGCFAKIPQKKMPKGSAELYSQGIRSLLYFPTREICIGAGDGTIELVEEPDDFHFEPGNAKVKSPSLPYLRTIRSTTVNASVTSLRRKDKKTLLAGTANCEIFSIDVKTFETNLRITCHTSTIYDVVFPHNFSEVFATAGKGDVRVWSLLTTQELLRICVPNFNCTSILFPHDGKSILTAWNDGIIRSFTPLTGRLLYAILNAHNKGVSALAIVETGDLLVSGGCEGQVRLWKISPYRQELICTLKEHKGPVAEIHINKSGDEAVTASNDGSCIIWDLKRRCRRSILFSKTLFMCVRYYPSGVQILTGGSDRKCAYWEVLDGSLVREVDASRSGAINTLDISKNGVWFVTGSSDQILKMWKYQEGITTHVGLGHSAIITAARFSPDGNYIVSTSAAGSIFIWKTPVNVSKDSSEEEHKDSHKDPDSKEECIEDLPSVRSNPNSEHEETEEKAKSESKKSSKNSSRCSSKSGKEAKKDEIICDVKLTSRSVSCGSKASSCK